MDFDYATIDKIINNHTAHKDFEITVQYAQGSNPWDLTITSYIESGTIGPGNVLIGDRVYTTEPVNFSGDIEAKLKAYKIQNIITKDVAWKVYVLPDGKEMKFGDNVNVLSYISYPLFTISGGWLVADYRYVPQFTTKSQILPGDVNYSILTDIEGERSTPIPDCFCPAIYDYYDRKKVYLTWVRDEMKTYMANMDLTMVD